MIKCDSGEYVSSNEIPKGNYVLNEEKTICENGGKVVSYNNLTGQIGFSFLGSDRCSLYFDKIIDTQKPVISKRIIIKFVSLIYYNKISIHITFLYDLKVILYTP